MKTLKAWAVVPLSKIISVWNLEATEEIAKSRLTPVDEAWVEEVIIRTVEDSEARDKYLAELMYDCGWLDKEIGLGDIWEKHFQVFLDEEYQEK